MSGDEQGHAGEATRAPVHRPGICVSSAEHPCTPKTTPDHWLRATPKADPFAGEATS